MHARRYRAETCRELCQEIDALLAEPDVPKTRLWRRSVDVLHERARAYAAIAAREWRRALEPLMRADPLAREMQLQVQRIEILGLRAFVLDQCGEKSQPLLHEAIDLARNRGLLRMPADAIRTSLPGHDKCRRLPSIKRLP
jgi:LuxR family maltose regulon positive regulatory protein